MDTTELEALIARCLKDFYDRRLQALAKVRLRTFLRRKNPYLFRARAIEKASELIEQLLVAHLQASDETIFGDSFFEPIARISAAGTVSDAEGVDFVVETADRILAVAVKSGPNIYNASQRKRQNQEFQAVRSRLYKLNKQFDAMLAHGYGRKRTEPGSDQLYRDRSGQVFWQEITGDSDFYLRLIRLMGDEPMRRREEFALAWDALVNRLTFEFGDDFCLEDGRIDWEKLTQFVSAEEAPKLPRKPRAE
jgi:hypothetical protein